MPLAHPVAIKSETETTATVEGWGVVFGGADLYDEFFTEETDFWLDEARLGPTKVALYDHGFDDAIKARVIGNGTLTRKTAADGTDGLWFEAQIEKANRYADQVLELVRVGVIGLSSGAVSHLIEREVINGKGWLKSWPIAEVSLTPTPAEPRTLGVEQVRSLVEHAESLKALLPEESSIEDDSQQATGTSEPADTAQKRTPEITVSDPTSPQENPMTDTPNAELDAIKSQLSSLDEALAKVLKHIEDAPAVSNAGYVTQDGGDADKNVKSFGDFLMAVKRGDTKRLTSIYGSVKDLSEGVGAQGGYLVPQQMRTDLLQVAHEMSPILSLVRTIPVNTDAGTWPALDQYVAPTAGSGNTAFAGGIVATNSAEGAALTETQAAFKELAWRAYKIGGYTEVSNELVSDSPLAIEALLRSLFAIAIAAKRERNILRGSGVGEPLGIMNAPCTIAKATATDNTFAYADALNMLSVFKKITSNVRWIMHQSVLPDFGAAGWTQGNQVINLSDLGYGSPVFSEHMPQANGDDVLLADLGAYVLFERQGLSIAFSEHAAFTSDKGTWRFTERLDGMPWLKDKITLADPDGSFQVSAFVYHDD